MPITIKDVVNRLLYDTNGQILISALFGFAIAIMFRRVCKGNCTIYYAPDLDDINNNIFKLEDTCYKYKPILINCKDKINILNNYDSNSMPDNKIVMNKSIFS